MEASHPLKALLSFHLASDTSVVLHLPYVLGILSDRHFFPSSHLTKWTSRINSLLHSKEAGARWAGLCLAHRTSVCSKSVMLECAQSWLGVAIPILSKKESIPVLRASIHLCRFIFSNATDIPEFQRQVSTPNVPKFSAALISFLEKDLDLEMQKLALMTLSRLVPLYPNIHRASHTTLSTIVTRIFAQSSPTHNSQELVKLTSKLFSVLHFTGGKVGAPNLWRKSLDETIGSAWTAFVGVRTTFPDENGRFPQVKPLHEEPTTSVTLSMERLRTSVQVLCDLLQSPIQRPVQIPVGSLINLASKLVLVTVEDETPASVDPIVWAMEISDIPGIWEVACRLITCLVKCLGHHLTPYSSKLLSYIAFHLEQKPSPRQRLSFLGTVHALLTHCHPISSPVLCSRLTKIVLSELTAVLPSQTSVQSSMAQINGSSKNKKGKKRMRTYEGDELFRNSGDVVCPTADDAEALLRACDVMQILLRSSDVPPALHSLSSRVVLALLLGLPQTMPATLSPYPYLFDALLSKIRHIAIELGSGTTSAMSKSLNLVIGAASTDIDQESLRKIDILIHPRLPPLVRPLPKMDSLTLFYSEESNEETEIRKSLGLDTLSTQPSAPPPPDVLMAEPPTISDSSAVPSLPSSMKPLSLSQVATEDASKAQLSDLATMPVSYSTSSLTSAGPQEPSIASREPSRLPVASSSVLANRLPSDTSQFDTTNNLVTSTPLDSIDDEEMPSINLESDSESES